MRRQRRFVKRIRQLYHACDFAYVLGFGFFVLFVCSLVAFFLLLSEGFCCSLGMFGVFLFVFSGLKLKYVW